MSLEGRPVFFFFFFYVKRLCWIYSIITLHYKKEIKQVVCVSHSWSNSLLDMLITEGQEYKPKNSLLK